MMKTMTGTKVAVLVANGFSEAHFIAAQKTMQEMGVTMQIVSPNQGLVNGWSGTSWGHNYAIDQQLNTALGADYDCLIIPGGERSMEKLMMTAHTRRFISSFMSAMKPVAVMGDAVQMMAKIEQVMDREVSGPDSSMDMVKNAGAHWMESAMHMDGMMLTGACEENDMPHYLEAMRDMMTPNDAMDQAA